MVESPDSLAFGMHAGTRGGAKGRGGRHEEREEQRFEQRRARFERWRAQHENRSSGALQIFACVHSALRAARSLSAGVSQAVHKVIVLREGLHLLGKTGALKLTAIDSHTSIVAFPGDVAVLSGGVKVDLF